MNDYNPAPSGASGAKIPILFGAVVVLLGANVWLYTQLDSVRNDFAEFRKNTTTELASIKESSSVSTQTARRTITSLKDELEAARRQAQMAAGQARVEAQKHADVLAKRLAAEQERQQQLAQQMKSELTQKVTEVSTAAQQKFGEVATDIGAVKTEVAANKTELERTISDLKRVTGDLGVQSGLIATNNKELAALKALGERNYFEFDIKKSKQPRRIGDVSVVLKKADTKRNRYTIELVADDKKVEKKDKNINEPVQFYTSRARQPYELVVNDVKKDQIVGYLSTPKLQAARN